MRTAYGGPLWAQCRARARSAAARDLSGGESNAPVSPRFLPTQEDGAFYLFFGIEGYPDSRALAKRIVAETGVGLAPGIAFGDAGEGFLRLCFARSPRHLEEAGERLFNWITR